MLYRMVSISIPFILLALLLLVARLIPFYCISNQHMRTPVCRQWGHLPLHSRWPQSWRCQSDTKEIPPLRASGTGVLQNLRGNQLSLESSMLLLLGWGMSFLELKRNLFWEGQCTVVLNNQDPLEFFQKPLGSPWSWTNHQEISGTANGPLRHFVVWADVGLIMFPSCFDVSINILII